MVNNREDIEECFLKCSTETRQSFMAALQMVYDEVFEILPPAIFEWQLYLLPKNEKLSQSMNNGLLMHQMSSGEKQMLLIKT